MSRLRSHDRQDVMEVIRGMGHIPLREAVSAVSSVSSTVLAYTPSSALAGVQKYNPSTTLVLSSVTDILLRGSRSGVFKQYRYGDNYENQAFIVDQQMGFKNPENLYYADQLNGKVNSLFDKEYEPSVYEDESSMSAKIAVAANSAYYRPHYHT